MELHTLGVRTGYSQADVTEFARALTGWTVERARPRPRGAHARRRAGGRLRFAELMHEPGDAEIMGKRYGQNGEAQARAVPDDLAANPATAKHLATKLARHFAGDEPPPAMVDRLTQAYLRSGGDLPTRLSRARSTRPKHGRRSRSSSRRRGNGRYRRCARSDRRERRAAGWPPGC